MWTGGSLLRLIRPGDWHCVDVEFDSHGRFACWYVNFQKPFQRTATGLDTDDLVVDLVVTPDRRYRVKDADDYHRAVADGYVSADSAIHVDEELPRVIQRGAALGGTLRRQSMAGRDATCRVVFTAFPAGAR